MTSHTHNRAKLSSITCLVGTQTYSTKAAIFSCCYTHVVYNNEMLSNSLCTCCTP